MFVQIVLMLMRNNFGTVKTFIHQIKKIKVFLLMSDTKTVVGERVL